MQPHASYFPLQPGIYLVSDRHRCGTQHIASRLIEAMQAGVAAVQLREKDLPDAALLQLAQTIRTLGPKQVPLILNRRPHLVRPAQASGIQIGHADIDQIYEYRRQMPVDALVGVSCHSELEVQDAYLAEADFAVVGPLYPTASKPGVVPTISPRQLALWQQSYPIPLFPIGGIGPAQALELRRFGIQRMGCMGSYLQLDQTEQRMQHLAALIKALDITFALDAQSA